MSWFSTLETERLIVREYADGEAPARMALMTECFDSDYSINQHQGWLDWTIASYREHGAMFQPPYGDYAVALKSTGELVGSVGLVPQGVPWAILPAFRAPDEPAHQLITPEFGMFWATLNAHRGKGYAAEAARSFMSDFIFGVMQSKRAVATTEYDNVASQRVMEKVGMSLYRNAGDEPFWFNIVGVAYHPSQTGSPPAI